MPTCLKCGAENTLGRIFCFRCGKKLDLAEPSAADLKIKRQSNVAASLAGFLLFVAAVAAVIAGLMLWPQSDALGQAPSRTGAQRVSLALRAMNLAREADSIGRAFRESDINAYFKELRLDELGVTALSVALTPDRIRLRMRRDDQVWHIFWMRFHPTFPRDLTLNPAELAAWTMLSSAILNLDETVTKG